MGHFKTGFEAKSLDELELLTVSGRIVLKRRVNGGFFGTLCFALGRVCLYCRLPLFLENFLFNRFILSFFFQTSSLKASSKTPQNQSCVSSSHPSAATVTSLIGRYDVTACIVLNR